MKQTNKQQVVEAAIMALAKKPGASMNEIAEKAGIGRATLYRYFPSRDNLIRELTLDSYIKTNSANEEITSQGLTGEELLRKFLELVIPLGQRYYFLALEKGFYDDPEIKPYVHKVENDWLLIFEDLRRSGVLNDRLPSAWMIGVVEGLIYTAWQSIHDGYIARRDAPDLVYHTLVHGLGTNRPNHERKN